MSTNERGPKASGGRAGRAPATRTTKKAPATKPAAKKPSPAAGRNGTTATKATTTRTTRAAKATTAKAGKATSTRATATTATRTTPPPTPTEAPEVVTATPSVTGFVPPRPKRVPPSSSDPSLGSGGRALLALRAEADGPRATPPPPPLGGPEGPAPSARGPFAPAPAENRAGPGLIVAFLATGLVAIGMVVGIVIVLTGSREKTPLAVSASPTDPSGEAAESPATEVPQDTSAAEGSADTAFAPVPGFSFKSAPASVIAELRQGFEEGMRSELQGREDLISEVLDDVSGRSVWRDGEQVALAATMKFDDEWDGLIEAGEFLAGVQSELGASEWVTVGGTDAIYADPGGFIQLLAYKDGTFLIVVADPDDRDTLDEVMTGLLANLG